MVGAIGRRSGGSFGAPPCLWNRPLKRPPAEGAAEAGEEEVVAEPKALTSEVTVAPWKDRKACGNKKDEAEDDSAASDDGNWGVTLWEDLPEVFPSAIIGRLMLIEAELADTPTAAKCAAVHGQLAEGEGHRAHGLRGAEDELRLREGRGPLKGHGKKGCPSTFWVERGDRWRVGLACHGRSRTDTVHWMGVFFLSVGF